MPTTVAELEAGRVVQLRPKLIDEVEKAYVLLINDQTFRALRGADDPEATVEGDELDDATLSAEMVREKGRELELPLLGAAKLRDIRLKMRAVERRFNIDRDKRHEVA